jgi:hypothetical protein
MPPITQILHQVALRNQVRLDIVEKDYALSYLAAAISSTPGMGERVVLKGGTALRKVVYPGYRFSEDLDYSTLELDPLRDIDALMQAVIGRMEEALRRVGPFRVSSEPLVLREPHPGKQQAFLVRVQFPGHRQPLCRVKVEITVDEPVLCPVETFSLIHDFPEAFQATLACYSLEEITAEKLRALLQSEKRLIQKGWGASRVCRDYYDLWHLLRDPRLHPEELLPLVDQKCRVRSVRFERLGDFLKPILLETARAEWMGQIIPFVPQAPEADRILEEVKRLILKIPAPPSRDE